MSERDELEALRADVRRYRGLLFTARPLYWVRMQDEQAARTWESAAITILELDVDGTGPASFGEEPSIVREQRRTQAQRDWLMGTLLAVMLLAGFFLGRVVR